MANRRVLMQGNEALAEGAIRAGVRFFAGYPITPATEVAEYMARRLPQVGGIFIQMEDELASMAAVIGASLAGVKAMTASSGPGITLKQENLGLAAMMEVPCVVVDVMRVGPATGMATLPAQQDVMQARWGSHGDRPAIALAPASVQDCFDLAVKAVNLAETFATPVMLLSDAAVGHMREVITLPDEVGITYRKQPDTPPDGNTFLPYEAPPDGCPPRPPFGSGYRWHAEGSTHNVYGDLAATDHESARFLHRRLLDKVAAHARAIAFWRERYLDDAEVVVVSYGISACSAAAAVRLARESGRRVGLLALQTLWPFPDHLLSSVAERARALVVVELNAGQVFLEVTRVVSGRAPVRHLGRVDGLLLTPQEVLSCIGEVYR